MNMVKKTDKHISAYPNVIFTSNDEWDPSILNDEYSPYDLDAHLLPLDFPHPRINQYGKLLNRQSEYYHTSTEDSGFYEYVDTCLSEVNHGRTVHTKEHESECLRPNFGWTTTYPIKKTLENTTQFARAQDRYPMRKHYKTPFPAAKVNPLNEIIATDTSFSDVPAHDDGIRGHGETTMGQVYSGVKSLLSKAIPMKSSSEMPCTLEDYIQACGAPNALFSNNAPKNTANKSTRTFG
jgi:hypothetical protein